MCIQNCEGERIFMKRFRSEIEFKEYLVLISLWLHALISRLIGTKKY